MGLDIEVGERPRLHGSRPLPCQVEMDKLELRDPIVAAILGDTRLALQPVEPTFNLVIHWLAVPPMLDLPRPIQRPLELLGRRPRQWATVKIGIFIEDHQTLHRLTQGHIGPIHPKPAYQVTRLASSTTTRVCTMMRGCLNMDPMAMEPIAVGNR